MTNSAKIIIIHVEAKLFHRSNILVPLCGAKANNFAIYSTHSEKKTVSSTISAIYDPEFLGKKRNRNYFDELAIALKNNKGIICSQSLSEVSVCSQEGKNDQKIF